MRSRPFRSPRPRFAVSLRAWRTSLLCFLLMAAPCLAAEPLVLQQGDHVCLIGNSFAELMQHDGWLEAEILSRFPQHQLRFRNLGFSGDELTIRQRSEGFGTPDEHLARQKADVIILCFGFNESFAGPAGLPKFKTDLTAAIRHLRGQKYNGRSAPRLLLCSPLAHENLGGQLPDGQENNLRLAQYAAATSEIAAAEKVPFLDVFTLSRDAYKFYKPRLTSNGIHLTPFGNKVLGEALARALFPAVQPTLSETSLAKLAATIRDRNFYWFHRYRTTDGYSSYGGRSYLKFVDGQTNREVMFRELEVLDQMADNRDQCVWAAARGQSLPPDDSHLAPLLAVKTNKPGTGPNGAHTFLGGEAAIGKMTVAPGMQVSLFADEKMFPELINPVQMAFDPRGRLWVATWPSYPHWKPGEEMNDRLLILEDTNGDGRADVCKTFADKLHNPTGFEFWDGGVIVACAPDLLFLKDTDGDDRADRREYLLHSLDSADTHHTANSFILDAGGGLYFQEGVFHRTQIETPYGPVRNLDACVWRFEPRTHKVERYISYGFANPHGHVFDRWGQDIVTDGTGAEPFHAALFSGFLEFPRKHPRPPTVYEKRTRPCPGIEILSSRHFPAENNGNLLVGNVIGFQGILQYKLSDKGASFTGSEVEPILSSSDPNFRPADLEMGPDGAIWFTDWQNPIIGHMQHNLRDPSRDRIHGRVYRVTATGRPLLKPVAIAGQPIATLLHLLREPEDRVRYRVRIEISSRPREEVLTAVQKWLAGISPTDPERARLQLEALWQHQAQNEVNLALLEHVLRSPDFHARAAATRVLCYWRDRVPQALELLRVQIHDESPRVRLEAIRALSFFTSREALEIAAELQASPVDEYLRYTFGETVSALEARFGNKLVRQQIAARLVKMLADKRLAPGREQSVLETICRYGGPAELQYVWEIVRDSRATSSISRRPLLNALAEAAITRKVQPAAVNAETVVHYLVTSGELRPDALKLAQAWKVREIGKTLRQWAADPHQPFPLRLTAIDALAQSNEPENLRKLQELSRSPQEMAIRFQAVIGLSQRHLPEAAAAAAAALSAAGPDDDVVPVVQAFLVRKNGAAALGAALASQQVSPDAAKRVLRAMFLAGRNDSDLAQPASRLAGVDVTPKPPTPAEVKQLAQLVMQEGNAARGELVFRRNDLGCIKCHAINKAGGNVGPDLGPLGGSSPVDYIVTSILDPNQAIKEEYLTKVISTTEGKVYTGIVQRRDKNQVILKDATGASVRIPAADIEEEVKGMSLMPEGITRLLPRSELLDLMRFISELGRPGAYMASPVPVIRKWQVLRQVPPDFPPANASAGHFREVVRQLPPAAWERVYGLVNGQLPIKELLPRSVSASSPSAPLWILGEFRLRERGPLELHLAAPQAVQIWINGDPYAYQPTHILDLPLGRHQLLFKFPAGAISSAGDPRQFLKVELHRPPHSRAQAEAVHED